MAFWIIPVHHACPGLVCWEIHFTIHFPLAGDHVILVRTRIVGRKGPFGVLKDEAKNQAWECDLLEFLSEARMTLFVIVIDKLSHLVTYGDRAFHPYIYCLEVLLERLRGCLNRSGGAADVLAEARGKVEDGQLKAAYQEIRTRGTDFISGEDFEKVLTSRDLKLDKKEADVAGLQIADLLASPSKLDVLREYHCNIGGQTKFEFRLNGAMRPKFDPYARKLLSRK
jgi:hypothetical protein